MCDDESCHHYMILSPANHMLLSDARCAAHRLFTISCCCVTTTSLSLQNKTH